MTLTMWQETLLLSGGVVAVLGAIVALLLWRRRALSREGAEALRIAVAENQHLPASLHPVIDPQLCIGSFSCIKACPEGDIIGVIDGTAQLIEGAHCIGHSRCAIDCPVGAIKLVFGTSEKGMDLPETDDDFESSRPGVFVLGELGGMGLIKNALRQGLAGGKAIKKKLGASQASGDLVDVVVVGGGPAGIATAISLKEQGLKARVFEQETVGGCIAHFPRGKVVMTERVILPYFGKFGRALLSKEELYKDLKEVIVKGGITIEEGHKVVKVEGLDPAGNEPRFKVTTSRDVSINCRAVVLAIGLRGTPRKMGVPGEDLPKVTYRLIDPEQYHGQRVLVVGGGDSAVEAAIQLAEESTAKVTISYRQDSFNRCKQRNKELIENLGKEGRVRVLLSTEIVAVEPKVVRLKTKNKEEGVLKNDAIIASLGGEMPAEFLKSIGVNIKKYKGEEKGAVQKPGGAPTKAQLEARTRRRLAFALFALGGAILAGLFLTGADYYSLPFEERRESPMHDVLKPAGLWGHSVGIIATVFMFANFLYAVRKRLPLLKGRATIRTWLTFHMFVGIMSPLVIAFHATFLAQNLLAIWTWVALAIVVGTGAFGRFLFGFVPAQAGRMIELKEVRAELQAVERKLEPLLQEATNPDVVRTLFKMAQVSWEQQSFFAALRETPRLQRRLQKQLQVAGALFTDAAQYAQFKAGIMTIARARWQMAFYGALKRLFRVWLVFHVVLAVFMAVLIGAHVAVTTYYGFSEWSK